MKPQLRSKHSIQLVVQFIGLLFILGTALNASAQIINTIVGNGNAGYGGDGGAATLAQLNSPTGIVFDANGNLYIADLVNHRIRKMTPSGIITTVAGNGYVGSSGDGGSATSAQLAYPIDVAVDSEGNIYIADQLNNRVRKVNTAGIITTVAGTGVEGYSGDGGAATLAKLGHVEGVEVDTNGNLYIGDSGNNRIRKVNSDGVITTVAGTGIQGYSGDGALATSARLNIPAGMVIDGNGNLYFADRGNNRIRKINAEGIISTVAGNGVRSYDGDGGPATSASLYFPTSVALDENNNLYIADEQNNRIRKVNSAGTISTIAGNGGYGYDGDGEYGYGALRAAFRNTAGVAVDGSGQIYIADQDNNRIRKINGPPSVRISPAELPAVCSNSVFSLTATTSNFTGLNYFWSSDPPYFDSNGRVATFTAPIVSVPTTYTLTVLADNFDHTRARDTLEVTVNPGPVATLSANGTLTCNQTSITLTAGTGTSYTLSDGQSNTTGQFVVTTPGLYSVTVVGANGCVGFATTTVFSSNTSPTVSLSVSGPLICTQTSVTLTAEGNAANYMFSGPGILSQSGNAAVVNVGGVYSVTATGSSGCTATQSITVTSSTLVSPLTLASSGPLSCSTTNVTLTATSGFSHYVFSGGANQQGAPTGNTALVNSSGVYAVTAVNAYGCQSIATVTITYQNCPPRVANTIPPQSVTVNQFFSLSIPTTTFTDTETPNNLSLYAYGLPPGLTFTAPNMISGTLSSTVGSPFSVTVIASDPDNLTVSTTFLVTVTQPNLFTISDVALVSCLTISPTQRTIRFNPNYSGLTGQPISFLVVNELLPTTDPGPYQLNLNTDNPVIVLKATQQGNSGEATFNYNWLSACTNSACTTMFSVKAGTWSDASIWSCGRVPAIAEVVTLNHAVSLPPSYQGQALRVIYNATGRLLLGESSQIKLGED